MVSRAFRLPRSLWMALTLAMLPMCIQAAQPFQALQTRAQALQTRASEDTVLVKFKPGSAADERRSAHTQAQGNVRKRIESIGVDVVQVPKGSVSAAIALYSNNPNVVYAEPNYVRPLYFPATNEGSEPGLGISNNFDQQYGLHNTGQAFGAVADALGNLIVPAYQATPDADINAPEGWAAANNQAEVAVAVIDSGVTCAHLDLAGKCIEEINFVASHGSGPEDVLGHGTHVAGIIAATTNNGIGIAGVAPQAKIGAMKVCWEDISLAWLGIIISQCEDADVASALTYVADSGLYRVINISLAGTEVSSTLGTAIKYAWDQGLVIIGAAGNAYSSEVYYPAGYDEVIAVGATDYHDNLAAYSTFGHWVSVLAPGTAILSTVPGGACGQPADDPSDCYDYKSGTSMAAPHVAGVAAVMAAQYPHLTNAQIRAAIEGSADPIGTLGQNFHAWSIYGRVNLLAALNYGSAPIIAETHSVTAILAETVNAGKGSKQGRVTVTVRDNLGHPVNGAVVQGDFDVDSHTSVTQVTDSAGNAVFTSQYSAKGSITFSFCVTNIASSATSWSETERCVSFP